MYGKILGFCYEPRLALTVRKDGKGTVRLLCCHTARAMPRLSLHQQVVPGLELNTAPVGFQTCRSLPGVLWALPLTAQRGQSTASLLALRSGRTTALVPTVDSLGSAPGCPGDVGHCHRAGHSHQPRSSALGHPASASSRLHSLRGFNELKYLAYK